MLAAAVRTRRPRFLVALSALLLGLGLSACQHRGAVTDAATEGLYLAAGPLTYQVQLSRELNPAAVEDRSYLVGLPPGTTPPKPDEEWFGVWLEVKNEGKQPARTSDSFKIVDTLDNTYEPIPLTPANPFAYQAVTLAPRAFEPPADSPAQNGPVQGSLLLFKLKTAAYQNRPVELQILAPGAQRVLDTVKLDL
jgi:hypothetical protein